MTVHRTPFQGARGEMPYDRLSNTICSKGHTHPPWNTTGVLSIAKCESMCGFCQKETKTAANLRKHVAIHIKNERLNLSIAEGSSGRGRLEMAHSRSPSRSGYNNKASDDEDVDPGQSPLTSLSHSLHSIPSHSPIHEIRSHQLCSTQLSMQFSQIPTHRLPLPTTEAPPLPLPTDHAVNTYMVGAGPQQQHPDLFHHIRKFNIGTKTAWIAIPTHEGFKAVETCRSLSATGSGTDGSQLPCYNREMIYDEEWQKHMKDVHGVFLLWPETWVKRIEVLDLDAVGGEIESCNDLIMG